MKAIKLSVRILSILYLAKLLLFSFSPYWPEPIWWIANILQMAPLWVLFIPVGVFLLSGIIARQKSVIIIQTISIPIIFFSIMDYNLPIFNIKRDIDVKKHCLRVMSYNIGESELDVDAISGYIKRVHPDIIAFQELSWSNGNVLKYIFPKDEWDIRFGSGLAIASKLKIKHDEVKSREVLGRDGQGNLVARYELAGEMGIINIFDLQLETPREGIEAVMENKIIGGMPELYHVTQIQEEESLNVSSWITPYKNVLIAGDFNMREANPIYKKYWKAYKNAFSEAGFGFGYTKFTDWHGVRIDHVLCDNNWRVVDCYVGPNLGSDHRPIVAEFEFIGEPYSEGIKAEVPYNPEMISDTEAIVFENFEFSVGNFERNEATSFKADEENKYRGKFSLKVERRNMPQDAFFGIRIKGDWRLEFYPIMSFAYKIPEGTPVGIRFRTLYNDWIDLKETPEFNLIADNNWHEISIDVEKAVQSVLPALTYLKEFQFYIKDNQEGKNTFWLDDLKIGSY